MSKCYVYVHEYPEGYVAEDGTDLSGVIFYVGKGTGDRILMHEAAARNTAVHQEYHTRLYETIQSIWRAGKEVVKRIVFETDDPREALEYERQLIAKHGPTLVNVIHNTQVNPKHVPPRKTPPSREEQFEVAVARAKSLNRDLIRRYPEQEREALLTEWDTASERQLRLRMLQNS